MALERAKKSAALLWYLLLSRRYLSSCRSTFSGRRVLPDEPVLLNEPARLDANKPPHHMPVSTASDGEWLSCTIATPTYLF